MLGFDPHPHVFRKPAIISWDIGDKAPESMCIDIPLAVHGQSPPVGGRFMPVFKSLWVKTIGTSFGVAAPPILVYFSGDWDVHWGYRILTHGQIGLHPSQLRCGFCPSLTLPLAHLTSPGVGSQEKERRIRAPNQKTVWNKSRGVLAALAASLALHCQVLAPASGALKLGSKSRAEAEKEDTLRCDSAQNSGTLPPEKEFLDFCLRWLAIAKNACERACKLGMWLYGKGVLLCPFKHEAEGVIAILERLLYEGSKTTSILLQSCGACNCTHDQNCL